MLDTLVSSFDLIILSPKPRTLSLALCSATQSRKHPFCADVEIGQDSITCNSSQKHRAVLIMFYDEAKPCIIPVRVKDGILYA